MKKRMIGILLALSICLILLPGAVFAAEPVAETVDFTVGNGSAAIDMLNTAKRDGAADSTWDSGTNTLILNGIDFSTTAAAAMKLPAESTIVLADGSVNTIRSGDVTINVPGGYKNQTFINALDADGSLIIQGEKEGTGTLEVIAGSVKNESDGWAYSSGIAVNGDFTVKSGHVTARGGDIEGKDSVFSIGVNMENNIKNKALRVTGGSLTAIAGESYEIQEDGSERAVFSKGVYMCRGNVSVSGSGRLTAQSPESMAEGTLLSNGLYISEGDLIVADTAEVAASGGYGVEVNGGSIDLDGGKLTAVCTQKPDVYGNLNDAISVETNSQTKKGGSITVSGGTLETLNGKIYMSTYGAAENQGVFTVTDGTVVSRGQLEGATKINISGGSVQTWGIDADALTLSGGSLTVREPVRTSPYDSTILLVRSAIEASALTVSGGTLDAAWDWGKITPSVLPVDEYYGYAASLVQMPRDFHTAAFTGGTVILDTGCAGNMALLIKGQLTVGTGVNETGADTGSVDEHKQKYSDTPVVFSALEPYPVQIIFFEASHKTYDGTTAVTLYGTLDGIADGDGVTLDVSNMTAAFEDANVGIGKTVNASGTVTLRGKDAYKYYIFQQPALVNLTANITPCTEFIDATEKTQTIYVGESDFEVPKFTGVTVNGTPETVTGSVIYQVKNADKTVKQIGEDLKSLKAGEKLEIGYTFTPAEGGNYSGEKSGTITVTVKDRPGSGVSSSTSYSITLPDKTEHGTVTANRRYAERGDTVTITVKPDSGYVLETLTAVDRNGKELKLTDQGDGKYTFTMPASRVEIRATFMEDNSVLNFFYDVPNDAYYYEAVKWAVEQSVTTGISSDAFGPDLPCTRAQIVTFLWRAAGSPEANVVSEFSDVSEESYYAGAVAWAIENGVTTGVSDDRFAPDDICTRAQAVTFLARALKGKASGTAEFIDVPDDSYYANAVAWAVENGVTNGVSGGRFAPNDKCTRAQIVTFLWRAYNR